MIVGRDEQVEAISDDPDWGHCVAALQVKGNFMFDPATHRDFLGAVLGTGVVRGRVGDVLVSGEQGAQILTVPELVGHFESSLTQVRTVPVSTEQVSLSELRVAPVRTREVRSVEASLRLDAVASAGFRMSRSKMVERIKSGDVRVNWQGGCKAKDEVRAGDVISCAGKGRVQVQSVAETKKGKFAVEMLHFA